MAGSENAPVGWSLWAWGSVLPRNDSVLLYPPMVTILHQMLDEAPPKELIPIDKPGPGIMPGEQEQQPREQQGRGSRPYVVPPRDSRVEQCKTDRQQGKDGEDSYGKAHFMIRPAHGRKDL